MTQTSDAPRVPVGGSGATDKDPRPRDARELSAADHATMDAPLFTDPSEWTDGFEEVHDAPVIGHRVHDAHVHDVRVHDIAGSPMDAPGWQQPRPEAPARTRKPVLTAHFPRVTVAKTPEAAPVQEISWTVQQKLMSMLILGVFVLGLSVYGVMLYDIASSRWVLGTFSVTSRSLETMDGLRQIEHLHPRVVHVSPVFDSVFVAADDKKYGTVLYFTPMFWVQDPDLLPALKNLRHDP